jgi:serine/threonine-protein kinase
MSSGLASQPSLPTGGEQGRAFLQERLAFLGRVIGLIVFGFYVVGNMAAIPLPEYEPVSWVAHGANRLMIAAILVAAAVWIFGRGPARSARSLEALDAGFALLMCGLFSMLALFPFRQETDGEVVSRSLLAITMTLVSRAVVIPSAAGRTLALSTLSILAHIAVTSLIFFRAGHGLVGTAVQTIWAGSWLVAAVVLSTLASRVIYGLREEVREARQLGQYTLEEKIGEGGMGAVYRARHSMLRRPTAIKLLPAGRAGGDRLERFEREVQLTSRLTHPNTVAIFDYGRTADGVFYYAMEYLEGLNLDDLVRLGGALPAGRVVHVLKQVAGALVEAHGVGLIHRDIKPANVILLAEYGAAADVAKVVDFGLVKELDGRADLTRDDQIAGTPLYLSPEAIRAPDLVDARSDLYSLGALGYFLLTGTPLFAGRNAVEICGHHLHTPPVPPTERLGRAVPAKLSALLLACLEKEPGKRPASARADRGSRRVRRCHTLAGGRGAGVVEAPSAFSGPTGGVRGAGLVGGDAVGGTEGRPLRAVGVVRMGKKTIAEFVTDAEAAHFVEESGVDYAQGFHVGPPRPLEELLPVA